MDQRQPFALIAVLAGSETYLPLIKKQLSWLVDLAIYNYVDMYL